MTGWEGTRGGHTVESNQNSLYMGMKLSTALLIKMDSVSKIIQFFFPTKPL